MVSVVRSGADPPCHLDRLVGECTASRDGPNRALWTAPAGLPRRSGRSSGAGRSRSPAGPGRPGSRPGRSGSGSCPRRRPGSRPCRQRGPGCGPRRGRRRRTPFRRRSAPASGVSPIRPTSWTRLGESGSAALAVVIALITWSSLAASIAAAFVAPCSNSPWRVVGGTSPAAEAALAIRSRWSRIWPRPLSWSFVASNCQALNPARMAGGRVHVPARAVVAASWARALVRVARSGCSAGVTTQVDQRLEASTPVRWAIRSSRPRQSGGPLATVAEPIWPGRLVGVLPAGGRPPDRLEAVRPDQRVELAGQGQGGRPAVAVGEVSRHRARGRARRPSRSWSASSRTRR